MRCSIWAGWPRRWPPGAGMCPYLSQEPSSMLQADVKLERDTADMYGKFLQKLGDPGLRGLLERIHGHELYHEMSYA